DVDWQRITVEDHDNAVRVSQSLVDKYRTRPAGKETMSLLDFTKKHKMVQGRCTTNTKDVVVHILPFLKLTGEADNDERYYKQQVTLHAPFRGEINDLLIKPNTSTPFAT